MFLNQIIKTSGHQNMYFSYLIWRNKKRFCYVIFQSALIECFNFWIEFNEVIFNFNFLSFPNFKINLLYLHNLVK
jgi:hypothetical protein